MKEILNSDNSRESQRLMFQNDMKKNSPFISPFTKEGGGGTPPLFFSHITPLTIKKLIFYGKLFI